MGVAARWREGLVRLRWDRRNLAVQVLVEAGVLRQRCEAFGEEASLAEGAVCGRRFTAVDVAHDECGVRRGVCNGLMVRKLVGGSSEDADEAK